VLVAFVLGLVIAFKQIANPVATLAYGGLYGVALGAISEAFNIVARPGPTTPDKGGQGVKQWF